MATPIPLAGKRDSNRPEDKDTPAIPATRDTTIGPNQCWVQLILPPRTEQQPLTVTRQDAREVLTPVPAVVSREQRQITTRDAAISYRVVEPRYKAVQEQVKVSDEVRRLIVEPAVYENRPKRIMVESERVELRTCRHTSQRPVAAQGQPRQSSQCAHTIPARYDTVMHSVLVKPETVREEITPARYQTVTRWVLEENGKAIEKPLPEQTRPLDYRAVVQDARVDVQALPAQTREITVRHHIGLPTVALRQVMCEHQLTPDRVRRIQSRLQEESQTPGPVDGKLGPRTWRALQDYQNRHGLPAGYLTLETLEHLGLSLDKDTAP